LSAAPSTTPFPTTISKRRWDFGDATTATGPAPAHTYAAPGEYSVTLTIQNSCGETDSASTDVTVNAPMLYAPLVHLSKGEKFFPDAADKFVAASALRWNRTNVDDRGGQAISALCVPKDTQVAPVGTVLAARLRGPNPYVAHPSYVHDPAWQHSDPNTRPSGCKPSPALVGSSNQNLHADNSDPVPEGFYLDLGMKGIDPADASTGSVGRGNTSLANGSRASPGTYYEYVAGRYVIYWLFYPYNMYKFDGITETHEGDWEHIVVRLSATDRATDVAWYRHYCTEDTKTWKAAPRQGTHPIVWAALGGHASYKDASGGTHASACFTPGLPNPLLDHTTPGGPKWETWRNLADARAQKWYGFGGLWGAGTGDMTLPHLTPWGPPGPSAFRLQPGTNVVPGDW
jgi:PKD repeat protein